MVVRDTLVSRARKGSVTRPRTMTWKVANRPEVRHRHFKAHFYDPTFQKFDVFMTASPISTRMRPVFQLLFCVLKE